MCIHQIFAIIVGVIFIICTFMIIVVVFELDLVDLKQKVIKMFKKKEPELTLEEIKKKLCEYTENPFSTDMRNMMQRIKIKDSPTGYGARMLTEQQMKGYLDKGICFLDYPVLDEEGNPIEGLSGMNFMGA